MLSKIRHEAGDNKKSVQFFSIALHRLHTANTQLQISVFTLCRYLATTYR
jgi:hypothetical protein